MNAKRSDEWMLCDRLKNEVDCGEPRNRNKPFGQKSICQPLNLYKLWMSAIFIAPIIMG